MNNTIIKDKTTRSRGKFKPAPNLSINEVKNVLFKKIEEETSKIIEDSSDYELIQQVDYQDNKINVVSLFSGAGGLDLGSELAGLASVIGVQEALKIFNNKEEF